MPRRRTLVILGVLALVGAAVLYWLLCPHLTAEERQLVGCWSRTITNKLADDTIHVLELNDDRSCRWAFFDAATGQPLQKSLPGRWSVQSGKLIIDYETRTWGRLVRGSPQLQSQLHLRAMNREALAILAIEPATLRVHPLATPPGTVQVYTRSGEQFPMPPVFSPTELGY